MDDTTIYTGVPDAADTVIGSSGCIVTGTCVTGASTLIRQLNANIGALYGAINPASGGAVRTYWNERGELVQEYIPPDALYAEPPKPEAKPKKPPPALPLEVWQEAAFDADRAWQATIAACKGVR